MRPLVRVCLRALVIVLTTVVIGEGAARVYYATQSSRSSHTTPNGSADIPRAERAAASADGEPTFQLHPVFGYTVRPGVSVLQYLSRGGRDASSTIRMKTQSTEWPAWAATRSNNLGFFSADDYPTRQPNGFVVGVFGGSVAQWFVLQAGDRLAELLALLPERAGRPVRVLNFAQPSFKQPQQLAVLAYALAIGQRFDVVINIDGFNEAALGGSNHREGIEPSLPAMTVTRGFDALLSASSDDASAEYLGRLAGLRSEIRREVARGARSRFSLGALVSDIRVRRSRATYESLAARPPTATPAGGSLLYTTPPLLADSAAAPTIAGQWQRASRGMSALARAFGAVYVHALQPNQYFGSRLMSPEERTVAYSDVSPYRREVETIYPELEALGRQLVADGSPFLDLTDLFDLVDETVYADDCCHYNQRGNEILAQALFEHLRR